VLALIGKEKKTQREREREREKTKESHQTGMQPVHVQEISNKDKGYPDSGSGCPA